LALTAIGIIAVLLVQLDRRADERSDLNGLATVLASSVERQLERSLSSTFVLASLIRQSEDRMTHDFDSVAAEIIETFGGIDNLQLAPGGIVSQIYPLEGNEQAIGHDLLNDPARRVEALATIESRKLSLAGPFELVQGGTAVIGRLPVFVPDDLGGERFWGFTIALIRLPNLLAAADLGMAAEQGRQYWLSRVHPDTGQRDVFAASAESDPQDSVTYHIKVPNGSWALHLRNSENLSELWFAFEIFLIVIFSAFASLFVYSRLQRATARKIAQQGLDSEILERRRVEAAELQLAKELSVVDEVARIVTSTLEIEQVYGEFAQQLGQLVEFDHVAMAVVDQDAGAFEYKYGFGQRVPGHGVGQVVPLEGTRTQKVLMTGKTLVTEDVASPPQFLSDPGFSKVGLRAIISTPLIYRGQVFGVLHLSSKKLAAFGPREQAMIERLANQIAPAVRNAQLYEQSKKVEDELRQSEARARALLESAPQGIIATSRAGEIVQVNDAALEIFGYSRDELLGQTVDMLLPQQLQPGHAGHRETYFSEPEVRRMGMGRDLHGLRKDGSIVPLEIGLSFVPTHDDTVALAFVADITERKAAEEAVRRWTEETSVMAEIGRTVSASLDINEVYDRLGEEIKRLIPFDRMSLTLVDYDSGTTSPIWVLGTDVPGRPTADQVPSAGSIGDEVVRTRSPILLEPETGTDAEPSFPPWEAGLPSGMAVPLFSRDAVIGVLQVRSKELGIYTQRHLEIIERIGSQIAGAVANSRLYAEREKAEAALRDSEEIFRQMSENLQEVIFLLDHKNYEVLYINRAYEDMWGRSRESLYKQASTWLDAIHPEDLELVNEAFEKQQATGVFDEEYRIIRPDGFIRWIHGSVVPIRDELGQIFRLVGIVDDITERKQAEDKLKASLQEKEVLLKEINHRVKNNLQIISSLLNLQSRDIQDEQALRAFQVSQERIRAMALVHEKLYQSEDLARIDFGEYIKSLAIDLGSSYGLSSRDIDLKIDVENILLGVDTAIPCGVIVNELVANSLKHAFPGDRTGEIAISFREVDGQYTMIFKDDGVGLPEGLDISSPSSLGLTIVNALTGQLGGTIGLVNNGGTEISITFPAK